MDDIQKVHQGVVLAKCVSMADLDPKFVNIRLAFVTVDGPYVWSNIRSGHPVDTFFLEFCRSAVGLFTSQLFGVEHSLGQ